MAPKGKAKAKAKAVAKAKAPVFISTKDLQARHAGLLSQAPYVECQSAFLLHKALHARRPPIMVTIQTVKEYFKKQSIGQLSATTAKDLHEKYGPIVTEQAWPTCIEIITIANYKCPQLTVRGGGDDGITLKISVFKQIICDFDSNHEKRCHLLLCY